MTVLDYGLSHVQQVNRNDATSIAFELKNRRFLSRKCGSHDHSVNVSIVMKLWRLIIIVGGIIENDQSMA